MGALTNILNFGNSKAGRLVSWMIVVFATLSLFGGIMLTAISTTEQRINELLFPTLTWDQTSISPGYRLEVTSRQTSISVQANPINTTIPVTFTIEPGFGDYLRFTNPRVVPGDVAVLNIINFDLFLTMRDYLQDGIRIDATAGNRSVPIFAHITLDPADVVVTATLERNLRGFALQWEDAPYIDMRHFDPASGIYQGLRQYRVRLTASLFGDIIFNTAPYINRYQYQHFGFEEIDQHGLHLNIGLFNNVGMDDPSFVMFDPYLRIPDDVSVNFRIWVELGNEKFFTDWDLSLNIRGWIA